MQNLTDIIAELCKPLQPLPTDVEPQLTKLGDIRCVLFDVYGTLMVSGVGDISHSSSDNRSAGIQRAMEKLGFQLNPKLGDAGELFNEVILEQQKVQRDHGTQYPEVEIREVWFEFLNRQGCLGEIEDFLDESIEELSVRFELMVNATWPMPNLCKVLEALHKKGLHLGIVSNAQFFTPLLFKAYTGKSVEDFGFNSSLCQWSYVYKEAKPSEHLYQINAELLGKKHGIQPHQVVYVGNDMLNDITPAQAVGFKTALFAGDNRSLRLREGDERVKNTNPDLIITDLNQLLESL